MNAAGFGLPRISERRLFRRSLGSGAAPIIPADDACFDRARGRLFPEAHVRFGREHRIRKRAEFLAIQAAPTKRVRTTLLQLLVRISPGGAGARLGIVATKRVGNAVRRNRAKRLIREAFRSLKEHTNPSWDCVAIVHPPCADSTFEAVRDELARALARASR